MAGRQRYDGDLEQGVRKFAVLMTWCSVFFRVSKGQMTHAV